MPLLALGTSNSGGAIGSGIDRRRSARGIAVAAGVVPMPAAVIGITAVAGGVVAVPAGVAVAVPAAVRVMAAGLIAGVVGVMALPAVSGPVVMLQTVNIPAGLVLHLVKPLPFPRIQAAVGPEPVLHPVNAGLFPVQIAGFAPG